MKPTTRRCALLFLAATFALARLAGAADVLVYFGSHGSGPHDGFSLAHFDTDTGKLTMPVFWSAAVAPAYFVIRPDGRRLYTCNSAPGSALSAYAIDPATGRLTFLNQQPSGGGDPSYISLDATGKFVMVANYEGGSIAVYALQPDGSLGERTAFIQNTGSSVNPVRQTQARAHSIRVDPSNRFVLAADLGLDKLLVYRFDSRTGALQPNDPPFARVAPGSGPRHITFSPDGRYLYLINEISSTVIRFGWDAASGALTPYETISSLPPDFKGTSTCAEFLVHPGGKYAYATNRGHNSVTVFSIDPQTGRLTPLQYISTRGRTPRNCEFDPTGHWLLVSNQDSNNAVVFRIDQSTGRLTQTGDPVTVPAPFCERFLSTTH